MSNFNDFMNRRATATREFCKGNPQPLVSLSTEHDPASLFSPDGAIIKGAQTVTEANERTAATFGPHGDSEFEIIHQASDGRIGYWAGLQRAKVEIDGKMTAMELRVTELFRYEDDGWKLVHRHADPFKPKD